MFLGIVSLGKLARRMATIEESNGLYMLVLRVKKEEGGGQDQDYQDLCSWAQILALEVIT